MTQKEILEWALSGVKVAIGRFVDQSREMKATYPHISEMLMDRAVELSWKQGELEAMLEQVKEGE